MACPNAQGPEPAFGQSRTAKCVAITYTYIPGRHLAPGLAGRHTSVHRYSPRMWDGRSANMIT